VKTNAMRLLDARGVAYRAVVYDAGAAFHDAEEVASLVGAPADTVLKTLVVMREGGGKPLLAVIPANRRLDPGACARAAGVKRVRMATQREAERLTGLRVGGISPLALLDRHFAVYVDASATAHERVHVSGGTRGVDLEIAVADLVRLTGAELVPLTG
jgi:Cys-tRNA(Pro)/Cys-tRNA(Cys) deacylase